MLDLIAFICASVDWWVPLGQGWAQFVFISALITTLIFFIFHLFNVFSKLPGPWIFIASILFRSPGFSCHLFFFVLLLFVQQIYFLITFFFSKNLRQILLKHGVKLHLAGKPYPIREDCNIMETNFTTYEFYSRTTINWAMLKMFLNVILVKITYCASSVFFSHFHLLLQNHWVTFIQT